MRASIVTWFYRLIIGCLLAACLMTGEPRAYANNQVYMHNGIVYAKHTHRPADGRLVLHNQAGRLLLEGKLRNGMLYGTVSEWYPDGALKTRYEYASSSLGLGNVVEVYTWYPDGVLSEIYQMRFNNHSFQKNGRDISWHENGTIQHLAVYKNGVIAGPEIGWDESGHRIMKSLNRRSSSTLNVPYVVPESFKSVGLEEITSDDTPNVDNDDSPDKGG